MGQLDPRIVAAVQSARCANYYDSDGCDGPDGCVECCERVARAVLAAVVDTLPDHTWMPGVVEIREKGYCGLVRRSALRATLTGDAPLGFTKRPPTRRLWPNA